MSFQPTAFTKLLIVAVVLGGGYFGYTKAVQKGLIPSGKQIEDIKPGAFSNSNTNTVTNEAPATGGSYASNSNSGSLGRPIRVGVVDWGGYAGGQLFNRGFKPNAASKYREKYGMDVEFITLNDYAPSREAWKAGEVDLLWTTADSFVTETESLKKYKPKVVFQSDWSRGGDAIVAVRGINTVADLKGKKVAVAFGTPSHTFLLWLLSAGGLNYSDINVKEAASAIDAAAMFKSGAVEAAVVWSPDDMGCVESVQGSKVLQSTKSASNIIADVFYAKQDFLEAHPNEVKNLIEGWLIGAAELNQSDAARRKAAKILSDGQGLPERQTYQSILNVRLCTKGDNDNFFNVNGNYSGVKGEELYTKMQALYTKLSLSSDSAPSWRTVTDTSFIRSISLAGGANSAEGKAQFASMNESQAEALGAVATKRATVNFASGSAVLDEEAKSIIDREFADISRTFGRSRILVSGNTDNTGSLALNESLSRKRAQAVANYLIQQNHFDSNRFTVRGNGPNQPVADNNTEEGRAANRRTDFELLNAQ